MAKISSYAKRERMVLRLIHLVFSIPILGYVYSPFDQIPNYAPAVRYIFLPALVLSGLFMWKGHVLRRLFSKGPARPETAERPTSETVNKLR